MGKPFLDAKIPVKSHLEPVLNETIKVSDRDFSFNAVSMGNPHCVIFTGEDSKELAKKYGPEIEISPLFPEKTNVEFVKILSEKHIKIDVWERGCGNTQASEQAHELALCFCFKQLTENKVVPNCRRKPNMKDGGNLVT
jgi:diaminopimelate epimerase